MVASISRNVENGAKKINASIKGLEDVLVNKGKPAGAASAAQPSEATQISQSVKKGIEV